MSTTMIPTIRRPVAVAAKISRTTSTSHSSPLSSMEKPETDSFTINVKELFCNSQQRRLPGVARRAPVSFRPTLHFLHCCGTCRRSLCTGRDIYIYRGETAFCSLECREEYIRFEDGRL